jgi:hypothetical protein
MQAMQRAGIAWPWAAALAIAALGAEPASAQGKLEPGEWELVSTTEVPGMYTGPIERTDRQCYTTADQKIWADKDKWAADMSAATMDGGCKTENLKQDGTALSLTLLCEGGSRIDILHDFRGTTGSMRTESRTGDEPGTRSSVQMKRVAEKCSEETIERWKDWNPGKEFVP